MAKPINLIEQGAKIRVKLDKPDTNYQPGESISGEVIIFSPFRHTIPEVTVGISYRYNDYVFLDQRINVASQVEFKGGETKRFKFTLFNKHQYETFWTSGYGFDCVVVARVEGTAELARYFYFRNDTQKFALVNNAPYEILQDELVMHPRVSLFDNLWLVLAIAGTFASAFLLFSQLGYLKVNFPALLMLGLVLLSFLIQIGVQFLIKTKVGNIPFRLVNVDDSRFNVLADEGGLWRFIKKASIQYQVTAGAPELDPEKGEITRELFLYESAKVQANRTGGMWASLAWPVKRNIPASTKLGSMYVEWNLKMKVKLALGLSCNYTGKFLVKRIE